MTCRVGYVMYCWFLTSHIFPRGLEEEAVRRLRKDKSSFLHLHIQPKVIGYNIYRIHSNDFTILTIVVN